MEYDTLDDLDNWQIDTGTDLLVTYGRCLREGAEQGLVPVELLSSFPTVLAVAVESHLRTILKPEALAEGRDRFLTSFSAKLRAFEDLDLPSGGKLN